VKFLRNFLKDTRVGAVAPTSSHTIKRLCDRIDLGHSRVIVEYGPGTGVFAEFLLERMPAESKLIMIETNPEFCKMLKRFEEPRAHVFNDSAENVRAVLSQCDEDSADCIISGIPFTFFDERLRKSILENTRSVLTGSGKFFVYQYSTFMKKHLQNHFGQVTVDVGLLNVPPMFIFKASG